MELISFMLLLIVVVFGSIVATYFTSFTPAIFLTFLGIIIAILVWQDAIDNNYWVLPILILTLSLWLTFTGGDDVE